MPAIFAPIMIAGVSIGISAAQIAITIAGALYASNRARSAKSKADAKVREMADTARAAMNLKFNTMSNVGNLPVLYGSARVGGYYCLQEVSSDKKFLHIVIAHAEGECGAVSMLYLDDTPCTDKKFKMRKKVQVKLGTVTEMYYPTNAAPYPRTYDKYEEQEQDYDLVKWEYFSGTDAQPACASLVAALPEKWTAAHKLSGIAYSYVRLEWNPDVWRSVPVITVQMDGKKVFDPRTGTTGASSNPALALRDYLLSPRYGRGLRAADISDAGFIAAANYCDQLIDMGHKTVDANQVESVKPVPRYAINGVLDTSRPCLDNVQEILEHCRGTLLQADGVYRPVIDQADVPVMTFDADVMVGKLQIKMADRRDRLNQLNCRFVDPARNFVESSAAVINAAWRIEDGDILLESSRDYSLAYDERRAKFLAERALRDSRNNISISFTALSQAQLVQPTDVIAVTHETTGWQNKQFRVINVKPLPSGEVEITANEYDPGLYADKPMTALPPAPATSLPDPFEILAAPASLTLVTDNQYGWAGEVQCRLKASWPAVQGLVVDYQVRWRKQSETVWQHMSTRELSATLPVVPGTPYFVSVAAVSAFGRVGLNVTNGATGVAPAGSLPDVTGVVCEFGPAGQFIFTWAKHADAAKYALEIITGGVTRRSDVIFTERYEYTLAMNRADAINRTVTIRVKALANDGRASANWVSKTENNAPPVALAGLVAWSNSLAIAFNCTPPTEVDLAGVICHLGDTPVFTPSAATLAYKGRLDTPTLLTMRAGAPLVVGKTYYLKAAAYDVFGDDGIVYSPSLLVKISTISGDILDIESLGPEKLTPGLIGDIGKGVEALDIGLPSANAKIDTLKTRLDSGQSGNLLLNADFLAVGDGRFPDSWVWYASNNGVLAFGLNPVDKTVLPSTHANTWFITQTAGTSNTTNQGQRQIVPCEAGKTYCASVYAADSGVAITYVRMEFVDAAGVYISGVNSSVSGIKAGGGLLSDFDRLFVTAIAPANAATIWFRLIKQSNTLDNAAYFTRPQLEILPAGVAGPTEWRAGQTTVSAMATNASVANIQTVLTDQIAGKAAASDLTALDVVVKNPTTGLGSKASQSQLNTVIAEVEGKASAQSLTNLEARVSAGQSGNLLLNADFLAVGNGLYVPEAWLVQYSSGTGLVAFGFNPENKTVLPRLSANTWFLTQSGGAATGNHGIRQDLPCEVGKRYCASVYVASDGVSAYYVRVEFLDAAGLFISGSNSATTWTATGGSSLGDFERIFAVGAAPANAKTVKFRLIKNGMASVNTLYFTRPQLEILPAGATGPTEWRAGQTAVGSLSTKTELAAQIQRIDQVVTDVSGKASASSVTSLTSEVGNVKVTATNALQTSVDTAGKIAATAGLMLDVNGHISGTKMYNDGTTAAFDIVADVFRVSTPDSIGRGEAVFSIGKVNGVNKIGVRGEMFIDGSVTARALSVANLQAVTTNTGALNVTGDLKMIGGAILGGACWGFSWNWGSGNMSQNMYLGPDGMLLGSANAGRYLEYRTGDGALLIKGGLFTASDISSGSIKGGAFAGYGWPAAGGRGYYLGPEGLLIGNYNDARSHFFQYDAATGNVTIRGDITATSVTAGIITADHIVARGITNAYSSSNGELWIEVPAGALVVIFISGSTTISGASGGSTVMATSCSASFQGQHRAGINFIAGVDFPVGTYPVSCRAGSTQTEAVAMVFRR